MESKPDDSLEKPQPNAQPSPGQAEAGASKALQVQPTETDPIDFDEIVKGHRRVVNALKAYLKPHYMVIVSVASQPNLEAAEARFERFFRPWPKWVFRLAAELWHVQCPTVPKETIVQTLRLLNICLFRCPTDVSSEQRAKAWFDAFDRTDLRVLPFVHAAFMGHALEHLKAEQIELNKLRAAGLISAEDYADRISTFSPERVEEMLRDCFASWGKDEDLNLSELIRVVEEARAKTFDKNGGLKETQLTPIYRAMLYNWMTVERMTGPKELSVFLTPQLKGKSKSATGEQARIATLCSRLGVKFRGKSRIIELR